MKAGVFLMKFDYLIYKITNLFIYLQASHPRSQDIHSSRTSSEKGLDSLVILYL